MLGQARTTQRYKVMASSEEEELTRDIIALASRYGRYGYRRITALLQNECGWRVNHKRVERIWRREGLKVPQKQPKRGRLWLNDGSCIRLRPEHKGHVWSYDFVIEHTANGKAFKILISSMSIPGRAWASRWSERSNPRMCSISSLTSLSYGVFRSTFAQIMDRNSPPKQSGNGLTGWE